MPRVSHLDPPFWAFAWAGGQALARYLPRARLVPLASYDVPGLAALEDRDVKRTTIWTLR